MSLLEHFLVSEPFINEDGDMVSVFLVMDGTLGDTFVTSTLSLVAEQTAIKDEFKYSYDNVEDVILGLLETFPKVEINNPLELQKAKNNVARVTRMGMANTRYENIYWYDGGSGMWLHQADRLIQVFEHEGKYAVLARPNFETFGFIASQIVDDVSKTIKIV